MPVAGLTVQNNQVAQQAAPKSKFVKEDRQPDQSPCFGRRRQVRQQLPTSRSITPTTARERRDELIASSQLDITLSDFQGQLIQTKEPKTVNKSPPYLVRDISSPCPESPQNHKPGQDIESVTALRAYVPTPSDTLFEDMLFETRMFTGRGTSSKTLEEVTFSEDMSARWEVMPGVSGQSKDVADITCVTEWSPTILSKFHSSI